MTCDKKEYEKYALENTEIDILSIFLGAQIVNLQKEKSKDLKNTLFWSLRKYFRATCIAFKKLSQ